MSFSGQRNRAIATLVGALAFAAHLHPAEAQESWEAVLKVQLEAEKKCQLAHMISVRQLPVEQLGGLEGRVRCVDGREFDFSRSKAHQKFELHLCMPAVC